jgi:hypothetical protein
MKLPLGMPGPGKKYILSLHFFLTVIVMGFEKRKLKVFSIPEFTE